MSTRMPVVFGDRTVGDDHPIFVTFEAGPTHHGVGSAKRLIDYAADAGGSAIKFQIVDPDRLVADKKMPFTYDRLVDRDTGRTETVTEPLYDILRRRALSETEWREVKAHADSRSLAFFATVTFPDEVEFVGSLGCDSVKIASADVNHFPLLRQVARTGMCIQLDTGMASLGEIEAAVDEVRRAGNERIIIHHCPSGYPARLEGINLNIIKTLRAMLPFPVAFSDHSAGSTMDIAAVAMGANLVEKTITEDRLTPSIEHIFSLEPPDMQAFVALMRDLPTAFGAYRRVLSPPEVEKRDSVRRSAYIVSGGRKGQALADCEVMFRRPGYGIGPDQFERLQGLRLSREVEPDHQLEWSDVE